jgi:YD repeat-containing protein
MSRHTLEYDNYGNLINYTSNNGKNTNLSVYDDKGNRIKYTTSNSDNQFIEESNFKYDENGRQIAIIIYDFEGMKMKEIVHKYKNDEKGNWIQKIIYKDEVPTFIIERTYDYY